MVKQYHRYFHNANSHIFFERLGQLRLPKVQFFPVSEKLTVKIFYLPVYTPNLSPSYRIYPADNYMFKVNTRNTRTRCGICSELTIKTPNLRQWRRSGVFMVNF